MCLNIGTPNNNIPFGTHVSNIKVSLLKHIRAVVAIFNVPSHVAFQPPKDLVNLFNTNMK